MKKYNITVNGKKYEVEVEENTGTQSVASKPAPAQTTVPAPVPVKQAESVPAKAPEAPKSAASLSEQGSVKVTSPMPGTILKINAAPGQQVRKGDVLCVLEAMKMENDIVSPEDGTVAGVSVSKGSSVNAGDLLVSLN